VRRRTSICPSAICADEATFNSSRASPFPRRNLGGRFAYGSFSEPAGPADVAIDNGFKLVIRNDGKGPNQLLDRRADPSKPVVNQYSNRAFITIRDGMRKSLNQWKTQYSRL